MKAVAPKSLRTILLASVFGFAMMLTGCNADGLVGPESQTSAAHVQNATGKDPVNSPTTLRPVQDHNDTCDVETYKCEVVPGAWQ